MRTEAWIKLAHFRDKHSGTGSAVQAMGLIVSSMQGTFATAMSSAYVPHRGLAICEIVRIGTSMDPNPGSF